MAELLKGKVVADALNFKLREDIARLKERKVTPRLAIVRVGEKSDDVIFESGLVRMAESEGIKTDVIAFPRDAEESDVVPKLINLNDDPTIHGILLFRPLPDRFNDNFVRNLISPEKDINGMTDISLASVYAGLEKGFSPCKAEACMRILDHFNIPLMGKKIVIVGRSLTVGKPLAMMLLRKNATVTICHSKTTNLESICKDAEILIVAAGKARSIGAKCFNDQQTIIDVGTNMNSVGMQYGDVDFAEARKIVKAITPTPGGVSTVTFSVLMSHLVAAANNANKIKKKETDSNEELSLIGY